MIGLWTSSPTVQRPFILNAHFDGFYTYFAATGFTYGSTPTNWVSMQKGKGNGKIFIQVWVRIYRHTYTSLEWFGNPE